MSEHDESLRDSKVTADGMWEQVVARSPGRVVPADRLEWQPCPPPSPGDQMIGVRQDGEPDEPFVVG